MIYYYYFITSPVLFSILIMLHVLLHFSMSTTTLSRSMFKIRHIGAFEYHTTSTLQTRSSSTSSQFPHYATKTTKKKKTLTYADVIQSNDYQIDPLSIYNGTLPMPKALSPSAASEFKNCPQSFLFQYILQIKQPPNLALAKGSVCHSALEQVFDLEPRERTLEHLQNLFRKNWSEVRLSDGYASLFDIPDDCGGDNDDKDDIGVENKPRDLEAERQWGTEALNLLRNYYQLEDPRLIPRPNPLEREIWVTAHLSLDPLKGATSSQRDNTSPNKGDNDEANHDTFYIRGIVDRLDFVAIPPSPNNNNSNLSTNEPQGAIRIVDYKTGKAPDFKYSPATNQKIANENMWQLKIYALLLREMIDKGKAYSKSGNLQKISAEDIRLLRLMYLTSVQGEARYLDMDLGSTQEERNEILQEVHKELSDIWKGITELVSLQDPTKFMHCNREWCYCHKIRNKFIPGSLNCK